MNKEPEVIHFSLDDLSALVGGWLGNGRTLSYIGPAPTIECAHSAVDTGMRTSWCRHCNADMIFGAEGWRLK